MELEKEVRYQVSDQEFETIKQICVPQSSPVNMIDITMGMYGKDSLAKTGRIFRVRQKPNKITLEIKKRLATNEWLEESIKLDSVNQGVNFLALSGMTPYLLIKRRRTNYSYDGLKISLDDVDMLGKFVEIEYQDSKDGLLDLENFVYEAGLRDHTPAPLYGDIIINKQATDSKWAKEYNQKLLEVVEAHSSEKY